MIKQFHLFVFTGFLFFLNPVFLHSQVLSCSIQINGNNIDSTCLCVGEDITINDNANGGTLPYNHLWTGGSGQLSPTNNNPTVFTATTPGTYTIVCSVSDNLGNTCTDTIIICVHSLPSLFTTPDDSICLGDCANINAITFNGNVILWYVGFIGNPIGDTSCTGCSSLTITVCPDSTTTYYAISVIDSIGCIRTKEVTVYVETCVSVAECYRDRTIKISPNPFKNEFTLELTGMDALPCKLKIFNSLSNLVMTKEITRQTTSINSTWFKSGIYFLIVEDKNGNVLGKGKIIKQ